MSTPRRTVAVFSATTYLGMLDGDDRSILLAACRVQQFPVGQPIFLEGGEDERVAVLLAGHVKLEAHAISGRKVMLGLRGPGDLLGEMRAFDGRGRAARISPIDDVSAGVVPMDRFRALVGEHPQLAVAALRMLTGRLREADRRRLDLGTNDALGRVSACLLDLARQYGTTTGGGVELTSPLTQEELGTWAGISRPATARAPAGARPGGARSVRRSSRRKPGANPTCPAHSSPARGGRCRGRSRSRAARLPRRRHPRLQHDHIDVLALASRRAADLTRCATAVVGSIPSGGIIETVDGRLYVANSDSDTLSTFATGRCRAGVTTGCPTSPPATVRADGAPPFSLGGDAGTCCRRSPATSSSWRTRPYTAGTEWTTTAT